MSTQQTTTMSIQQTTEPFLKASVRYAEEKDKAILALGNMIHEVRGMAGVYVSLQRQLLYYQGLARHPGYSYGGVQLDFQVIRSLAVDLQKKEENQNNVMGMARTQMQQVVNALEQQEWQTSIARQESGRIMMQLLNDLYFAEAMHGQTLKGEVSVQNVKEEEDAKFKEHAQKVMDQYRAEVMAGRAPRGFMTVQKVKKDEHAQNVKKEDDEQNVKEEKHGQNIEA